MLLAVFSRSTVDEKICGRRSSISLSCFFPTMIRTIVAIVVKDTFRFAESASCTSRTVHALVLLFQKTRRISNSPVVGNSVVGRAISFPFQRVIRSPDTRRVYGRSFVTARRVVRRAAILPAGLEPAVVRLEGPVAHPLPSGATNSLYHEFRQCEIENQYFLEKTLQSHPSVSHFDIVLK